MEWFIIYLFVCIEKFATALAAGWWMFWVPGVALGFLIVFAIFMGIDGHEDFEDIWEHRVSKFIKSICKWLMPIGFVLGTIGHFLPTQKELAIIVGSGVTYNVITSETGKRLGGKAVELLERKIDEALKDNSETPVKGKSL